MDERIDMIEMEKKYPEKIALLNDILWDLARLHRGIARGRINEGIYTLLKEKYEKLSQIDLDDNEIAGIYTNNAIELLQISEIVLKEYNEDDQEFAAVAVKSVFADRKEKMRRFDF